MLTTNVYALKLANGKYYIGKSDNLEQRIQSHFSGSGAAWTREHKPLKLVEIRENVSHFEEDKMTKEYMEKYGIDNVRGGAYTQVELPEDSREYLRREIRGSTDVCFKCNRKGHWANQCYAKTVEIWCCEYCHSEFDTQKQAERHESSCGLRELKNGRGNCYRCGRTGHWASQCYARI
jgi:cellular nucleic acid-binding protein